MPPSLPPINRQVNCAGTLNYVKIPANAAASGMLYCRFARSLVSFADCGRTVRDVVLSVLCGTTMGLVVAVVGGSF
jgi:hypothetical protein